MKWLLKKIQKVIQKIDKFLDRFIHSCVGSGSGYYNSNKYNGIKLIREPKEVIGKGLHRTGWPWVFDNLKTIKSENGILFDDFFEQNFCYKDKPDVYKEPWATIIHHPANIPSFGNYRERLDVAFQSKEFKESEKNLKLVFALSDSLASWLRTWMKCKVVSLHHPAYLNFNNKWENDNPQEIYQIGFYLRNTSLADQIQIPENYSIYKIWNKLSWLQEYSGRVEDYWRLNNRNQIRESYKLNFVLPTKYDKILNSGIIVCEYFEVSASNVILECIAHETPIIVNRKPAIEQYLGKDYPLFYDDISEIPELILRAKEGNSYLKNLTKENLHIDFFLEKIKEEISKLQK